MIEVPGGELTFGADVTAEQMVQVAQRFTIKVAETPAERLQRLALIPDTPREDLWQAIAAAVIDINERMAELEVDAEARRRVVASIEQRLSGKVGG